MSTVQAAIGLGSNLGDPISQLQAALQRLQAHDAISLTATSSFYRSAPQGDAEQPDYVNACALIETTLAPHALLAALQAIERDLGKIKRGHWQAREIDLDLLLYGDAVIQSDDLTVPHPWLHKRDFVLVPLAEIAPDWMVPGKGSVSEMLAQLPDHFIQERL
ncbi:2-amino-4-hydroxy-6-hydroxymethyldihydropteridinediphosphokinase [Sulfurivirga caldicuralii]|uniref:2-amino-4-hydroxy-6-hydroxymethyldihydropteridine pyrophosphokinase n=1 Tax=Sulfurivirga caldicuralii TaxID=364032 RepID=A0A1N6EV50_9GAMM|nr:2-amino-4-hydroxy-6-hydroxymethyldihydropteridine diphosphokinase [Sulfurivirga caldicuralii]SIN86959.1 2-amino-4-hydroxy-6-hydroxymethyldihydropteridinediphosphokinase [Sulfurivirga caldicuralii]